MTNYIAAIHKEKTSNFGISFLDFPGCITAAKSIDEAKNMAREALEGHIELMISENLPLPIPSNLEFILKDKNYKNAIAYFVVDVESH